MNRPASPKKRRAISSRTLTLEELPTKGKLIVFEGVDGSGKTTAITLAKSYLESRNIECKAIDALSPETRQLPHFRLYADDPTRALRGETDLPALCVLCLGDRLMNFRVQFNRLMRQGVWLLCDRYIFTPLAEMHALRCSPSDVRLVQQIATFFPKPHLGFLANVGGSLAIERIRSRVEDRNKILSQEFYDRATKSFRVLAKANDLVILNTQQEMEKTVETMKLHLDRVINNNAVSWSAKQAR